MLANALAAVFPSMRAAMPGPLDPWWYGPVGRTSSAGISVTPESAMAVSTVFACISLLSETLGGLSFQVCLHHSGDDGEWDEPDKRHPLWNVIHEYPNPWQTSREWREMGTAHLLLRGNCYCLIIPGLRGSVDMIVPLNPDRMKVTQLPNYRLRYDYTTQNGQKVPYNQEEILHLRGLSLDGIVGVSVIEYARHSIGLSIAEETAGGGIFTNGGVFHYALETDRKLGTEGRKNLRESWRGLHAGAGKAHNPPVLEDGLKIHELGMNLNDSQWIEGRGFQAVDICRFFRTPPHMVGILDRSTFNNIEQMGLDFVTYTLRPWCGRWTDSGRRDLLQDPAYILKLDTDSLIKSDRLSRYNAHNLGLNGGWLTRNEVRREEGLKPIEGGDTALEPLNMAPAGSRDQATQEPPQQDQPKEPQGQVPPPEPPDDTEQVQATFVPLMEDAAARIVEREIKGLESRGAKAETDRTRFDTWATNEFYPKHREYVARVLAPIAQAWHTRGGNAVDPEQVAIAITVASLKDLYGNFVPSVLERWAADKAEGVSQTIQAAFFSE